jgi:hypothetical protein
MRGRSSSPARRTCSARPCLGHRNKASPTIGAGGARRLSSAEEAEPRPRRERRRPGASMAAPFSVAAIPRSGWLARAGPEGETRAGERRTPGEAGHQRSWSASRAGPGGSRVARDRRGAQRATGGRTPPGGRYGGGLPAPRGVYVSGQKLIACTQRMAIRCHHGSIHDRIAPLSRIFEQATLFNRHTLGSEAPARAARAEVRIHTFRATCLIDSRTGSWPSRELCRAIWLTGK